MARLGSALARQGKARHGRWGWVRHGVGSAWSGSVGSGRVWSDSVGPGAVRQVR